MFYGYIRLWKKKHLRELLTHMDWSHGSETQALELPCINGTVASDVNSEIKRQTLAKAQEQTQVEQRLLSAQTQETREAFKKLDNHQVMSHASAIVEDHRKRQALSAHLKKQREDLKGQEESIEQRRSHSAFISEFPKYSRLETPLIHRVNLSTLQVLVEKHSRIK